VHKNERGELGVLGVLVQEGHQNLALEEIWGHLPQQADVEHVIAEVVINARDLLPRDPSYYRYMGSLTTPPCSEGVNWHVMAEPIEASADQIRLFVDVVGINARPVQPTNGRMLVGSGPSSQTTH
jgi:carbonic anhydrase